LATLLIQLGLKLIKDPVHGYVTLSDEEINLVDSYAVQRLRRINQLPLVYLVYPGARHSRFDHSLGSMYLAGEFAHHLKLDEYETKLIKTSALLHDIGHTPYSHLLETLLISQGTTHEEVSIKIISEDEELAGKLDNIGVARKDVVEILRGKSLLSGLVSGPLDVDRLDFLVRDAYFTGATYGLIDVKRIIHLTRLLEDGLAVDVRGIGAVEELAIARYHSFINIYFHHAVRGAQLLFLKAALKIRNELNFNRIDVKTYVAHDDLTIWCRMKSHELTKPFIERLERRILPKRVYEKQVFGQVAALKTVDEQLKVEREIAEQAGVDDDKIFFDASHAPPLTKYGPGEVRLYPKGEVDSWILNELSKPLHVFRVYVDRDVKYIDKVRRASEDIISSVAEPA